MMAGIYWDLGESGVPREPDPERRGDSGVQPVPGLYPALTVWLGAVHKGLVGDEGFEPPTPSV